MGITLDWYINWTFLDNKGYIKKHHTSQGRYVLTFLGHVALVDYENKDKNGKKD